MRKFWAGFSVFLATVGVLFAQTIMQRPLNPQTGLSAGVSYYSGSTDPTSGVNGEVIVVRGAGTDSGPVLGVWDGVNGEFDQISTGEASVVPSTLATNGVDVANSVWGGTNQLIWEGSTADGFEGFLQFEDPDADIVVTFPDHNYGADTYDVVMTPDGHAASGYFSIPPLFTHTEDVSFTSGGANTMYVYRMFLPHALDLTTAAVLLVDGGALAAADIVGIAVYEDADAGTRLATGTGDGTAAGLESVDVTDVSLYPGFYRFAICTSDQTNMLFAGTLLDDEQIDIISGVAGQIAMGSAANACVAGVPPATTGAVSTADVAIPFIYFY